MNEREVLGVDQDSDLVSVPATTGVACRRRVTRSTHTRMMAMGGIIPAGWEYVQVVVRWQDGKRINVDITRLV